MNKWKKQICGAVFALLLTVLAIPGQAALHREKPSFENPNGMTVDLIYYYTDTDGTEKVVETVERAIIPAGTAVITVEVQQRLIPQGHILKEPADIALSEDTREIRIPVLSPSEQTTDPTKPSEPVDPSEPTKPSEPADPSEPTKPSEPASPSEPTKPSEPAGPSEPTKPSEPAGPSEPTKPTEPVPPSEPEKPAKPSEKPEKPAQKPGKPSKPAGKPDSTNPQTGDRFPLGIWLTLGLGSAALLAVLKFRNFRR